MSSSTVPAQIRSEPLAERFQAFVFSQRNVLAGLPLAIALAAAETHPGVTRFAIGAAVAALGVAIRAASTMHNAYAQGGRKTLATDGPYRWCRNPLYVGNGLLLLGAACVAGPVWGVPVTAVWAALVYDQVVRHEERRLLEKYGAAYVAYRNQVPRWLPRPRLLPPGLGRALLVQSRCLLLLLPFVVKAWLF